jgi:hypothetical protein
MWEDEKINLSFQVTANRSVPILKKLIFLPYNQQITRSQKLRRKLMHVSESNKPIDVYPNVAT